MSETLIVECIEHNDNGTIRDELEITGPEGGVLGCIKRTYRIPDDSGL